MIVCVTFSKLHWSAMKVKSVASKSCCKGTTLSKSKVNRASSPHGGLFNYTNKNMFKEEKTERSLCAPHLNEIYNHSVHKDFGKYIFCLLYTAIT